jgi:hypothetical protein
MTYNKLINGPPRMGRRISGMLLLASLCAACGHSATQRIGLMSVGDLSGRRIPEGLTGRIVEGSDCGIKNNLSSAVRNALKGTPYDTLIDSEVTDTTGLFIWSSCLNVRGQGIDSKTLPATAGGAQ